MKIHLKTTILLSLISVLLLLPSMAYAHGMFLRLEEPGVLRVEYDGGGFSPRTVVTIYDEAGNELGSGPVDEEGKFHFDPDLNVHRAVADDGLGHKAEYREGVEQKSIPKLPVIIGVFVVIGIIFAVFNRKAKNKTA